MAMREVQDCSARVCRRRRSGAGLAAAAVLSLFACSDHGSRGTPTGPISETPAATAPGAGPAPGLEPAPGEASGPVPAAMPPRMPPRPSETGGAGAKEPASPGAEPGPALNPGPRYYVAPDGDDASPGSAERPFASLQHALDTVPSGEIVVRAGTYREHLRVPAFARDADHRLLVSGEAGAIVTSVGAARGETDDIVYLEGVSHVSISGLTLIGGDDVDDASGIRIYGSGAQIALVNNEISGMRGTSAMGITVYGADGPGILDVSIEGNFIHDCEPAPSEALVVNGNVQGFLISGNRISDVNNIGIDVVGGEQWLSSAYPGGGHVIGNQVLRANSNYDGSAACIYVDGASDLTIEKNRVSECDFGIEVGAENPGARASRVVVRDNLVYGNYRGGIIFGGYEAERGRVVDSEFLHNSLYANARPGQITAQGFEGEQNGELIVQFSEGCRAQNNIFYGAPGAEELVSYWGEGSLRLEHNLYYPEESGLLALDLEAVLADPRFADPQTGDLHLLPSSPAIDAALPLSDASDTDVDGETRSRTSPDLGADEAP